MNRDGHNEVRFFVGAEVELTPAHSKRTLFVVGFQDTAEIEKHAKDNRTQHIFLGANHSFSAESLTEDFAKGWDNQIRELLNKGFMVTLDYQAHEHERVLNVLGTDVWKSRNFVPLLGVRIPKITESNSNLTIKIDDIDFNATNPGVWCMHFTEVTDSNRFTAWGEYESDEVINSTADTEIAVVATDLATNTAEVPVAQTTENKDTKNSFESGLDPDSKSLLKPDENEVLPAEQLITTADAAEAYTADVKPTTKKDKKVQQ